MALEIINAIVVLNRETEEKKSVQFQYIFLYLVYTKGNELT